MYVVISHEYAIMYIDKCLVQAVKCLSVQTNKKDIY